MILTLCYAIITAIGTGYSFFFFREFEINIIKFADLSDFLLAAVLEPLSLIIFSLIIVLSIISFMFESWLKNRFPSYRRFTENRLKAKYTDPIGYVTITVIYSVITVHTLAVKNADIIKSQGKDTFQVYFSRSYGMHNNNEFELLGSTSRFVYLFDRTNKKSLVISPENIDYMSKVVIEKVVDEEATSLKKQSPKKEAKQ